MPIFRLVNTIFNGFPIRMNGMSYAFICYIELEVCSGIWTTMSQFFVLYAFNFGNFLENCTFFVFLFLDIKKRHFSKNVSFNV